MYINSKYPYILAVVMFSVFVPLPASAVEITVTPVVIDIKAHARDIEKRQVTLENKSGHLIELYPFVYGVSTESGETTFLDPSKADFTNSLANWIELSRAAIMIKSGQKIDVPFLINVNLRAVPAVYHAIIIFAQGSTRDEAEKRLKAGVSADINLEVLSDAKNKLQLSGFGATRSFWLKAPIEFDYRIENVGNRPEVHIGEIRIYNKRGEEVGSTVLNSESEEISPDTKKSLGAVWEGPKSSWLAGLLGIRGFGKYKAVVDIEYGPNGTLTLQDTAVFWIIPAVPLTLLVIVALFLIFFIRPMIHRRHKHEML